MIDVNIKVLEHLAANAPLCALTGNRIYAGRDTPPPGYDPSQGNAICFTSRGGNPDYPDALLIVSFQFKCYAPSELDAFTLYRTLYDALHTQTSDFILHAESETFGQVLEEPDTNWIFALAFFSVMLRAS